MASTSKNSTPAKRATLQSLAPALRDPEATRQLTKLFNVAAASLGPSIVSLVNNDLENFLHYNSTPAAEEAWCVCARARPAPCSCTLT